MGNQNTDSGNENPYAVPTFECIGIYYRAEGPGECKVEYCEAGGQDWRESLGLVYDPRDGEYRGSLVGLKPDTEYAIRLSCEGKQVELRSRTLSETFPVGKTTYVENGAGTVHIGQVLGHFQLGSVRRFHDKRQRRKRRQRFGEDGRA